MLKGKRILLGITGGIAAYKAAELVRLLVRAAADVRVAMTEAATRFVTPVTFQALSGQPVWSELWDPRVPDAMGHIELSRDRELIVVAPASADFMAKVAHGLANDLLSTLCVARRCPLMLAPAMNVEIWENAATQRDRGILCSEAACGQARARDGGSDRGARRPGPRADQCELGENGLRGGARRPGSRRRGHPGEWPGVAGNACRGGEDRRAHGARDVRSGQETRAVERRVHLRGGSGRLQGEGPLDAEDQEGERPRRDPRARREPRHPRLRGGNERRPVLRRLRRREREARPACKGKTGQEEPPLAGRQSGAGRPRSRYELDRPVR